LREILFLRLIYFPAQPPPKGLDERTLNRFGRRRFPTAFAFKSG
jgi:hypothetical protein